LLISEELRSHPFVGFLVQFFDTVTWVSLRISAIHINPDLAVSSVRDVHVIPAAHAVGILGQWDMD